MKDDSANPPSHEDGLWYNKALQALDEGNWLKALQYLKTSREREPSDIRSCRTMAELYLQHDHLESAQEVLRQALTIRPDDLETLFLLGNTYLMQTRYRDALKIYLYLEKVADDPSPELFFNIALSYCYKKENKKAIWYLEETLEQDPSFVEAYELLGGLCLEEDRLEKAKWALVELLELEPDHLPAHQLMGKIYAKESQWKEAVAQWEYVISKEPELEEALQDLGWALHMVGKEDRAVEVLNRALKVNPKNVEARIDLGAVLMACARIEDAIREWKIARKEDPHNPVVKKFLAEAVILKKKSKYAQNPGDLSHRPRGLSKD